MFTFPLLLYMELSPPSSTATQKLLYLSIVLCSSDEILSNTLPCLRHPIGVGKAFIIIYN